METTTTPNAETEAVNAPPASLINADDTELTKLDPNYVHCLRLTAMLSSIPVIIAGLVFEAAIVDETPIPGGVVLGVLSLLCLAFIIRLPARRYFARGYNMSADRLRVVRGIWWNSDTVVPFGRVQHIDVDQGPLERFFGLGTLTLHTAGSHNASVLLPGLKHELATEMREEIRAHIKRDTM